MQANISKDGHSGDDEQTDDQPQYEQSLGLADETTMINLYAIKDMVETWTEEAEDRNFSTRNKYLLTLIEEAITNHEHGDNPGSTVITV